MHAILKRGKAGRGERGANRIQPRLADGQRRLRALAERPGGRRRTQHFVDAVQAVFGRRKVSLDRMQRPQRHGGVGSRTRRQIAPCPTRPLGTGAEQLLLLAAQSIDQIKALARRGIGSNRRARDIPAAKSVAEGNFNVRILFHALNHAGEPCLIFHHNRINSGSEADQDRSVLLWRCIRPQAGNEIDRNNRAGQIGGGVYRLGAAGEQRLAQTDPTAFNPAPAASVQFNFPFFNPMETGIPIDPS